MDFLERLTLENRQLSQCLLKSLLGETPKNETVECLHMQQVATTLELPSSKKEVKVVLEEFPSNPVHFSLSMM